MFSNLLTDPQDTLLTNRLARIAAEIRALNLSTREEYQAALYSRVNAILALGTGMVPLSQPAKESPAILGDLTQAFAVLNQDGQDIASLILGIESNASALFNLAAASQNSLRQQIRELLLSSNQSRYLESFVSTSKLGSSTATIDTNAAVATLPLLSETVLNPTITIGPASVGTTVTGPEAFQDSRVETALVFTGTTLELVFSFNKPQIVNRLQIEMDDYQGLEIVSWTTSPDGTLIEDILAELDVISLDLNGIQSKYSGDFYQDFDPKYVQTMRLVIEDRVGDASIALRSMTLSQRKYDNAAIVASGAISQPSGTVLFEQISQQTAPYTSITHQISYDGVSFLAITPGASLNISGSYWYRAILERADSAFSSQYAGVDQLTSDPVQSAAYVLQSSNSIPLGSNLSERTLVLSNVTGPITLREIPIPGSLQVLSGTLLLGLSDYAFSGGVISFPTTQSNITISYQTSVLGPAAIEGLKSYYSPILSEFRFTQG